MEVAVKINCFDLNKYLPVQLTVETLTVHLGTECGSVTAEEKDCHFQ